MCVAEAFTVVAAAASTAVAIDTLTADLPEPPPALAPSPLPEKSAVEQNKVRSARPQRKPRDFDIFEVDTNSILPS